MAIRNDSEYYGLREKTSLAMAVVAIDPAARFSHLELARRYRLRGDTGRVGHKPA